MCRLTASAYLARSRRRARESYCATINLNLSWQRIRTTLNDCAPSKIDPQIDGVVNWGRAALQVG